MFEAGAKLPAEIRPDLQSLTAADFTVADKFDTSEQGLIGAIDELHTGMGLASAGAANALDAAGDAQADATQALADAATAQSAAEAAQGDATDALGRDEITAVTGPINSVEAASPTTAQFNTLLAALRTAGVFTGPAS